MTSNIATTDAYIRSAIRAHVKYFWPNSELFEENWEHGPIRERVPNLTVLRLRSATPQRPVIYVTNGCFVSEPTAHIRHEFLIIAPQEARQHLETLSMLASFHADERFRLDVGSIVNIGDPWLPNSLCDHLLISHPYPYGLKLEWLKLSETCVRFLWALPITAREAAFAELNGFSALEEKFDTTKLDYPNPHRSSVV